MNPSIHVPCNSCFKSIHPHLKTSNFMSPDFISTSFDSILWCLLFPSLPSYFQFVKANFIQKKLPSALKNADFLFSIFSMHFWMKFTSILKPINFCMPSFFDEKHNIIYQWKHQFPLLFYFHLIVYPGFRSHFWIFFISILKFYTINLSILIF